MRLNLIIVFHLAQSRSTHRIILPGERITQRQKCYYCKVEN